MELVFVFAIVLTIALFIAAHFWEAKSMSYRR